MSEVPPGGSDGEPVEESSNGELGAMRAQGPLPGEDRPVSGQPQVEPSAPPEWWRVHPEAPTPTAPAPPAGTPPPGTPPFGAPPAGSTPPFGTPPFGTPPPGAPPPGAVPPGTPPWSMPGWAAPPWAGAPQWYGWGPGWTGGPPQPPSGSSSAPSPRHHPLSWAIVGGLLAAIAMVALGLGIGYSVWGGASAPAAARHRVTVPLPGVSPFTRAFTRAPTGPLGGLGRVGFLGVRIAPTSSATTTSGAHVEGVVASSPAAKAGIVKGDTITEFGTRTVASARTLEIDVVRMSPGSRVKVEWVTSTGKHESATVTLASRPATSPLG
jgi:hypothetical protein